MNFENYNPCRRSSYFNETCSNNNNDINPFYKYREYFENPSCGCRRRCWPCCRCFPCLVCFPWLNGTDSDGMASLANGLAFNPMQQINEV